MEIFADIPIEVRLSMQKVEENGCVVCGQSPCWIEQLERTGADYTPDVRAAIRMRFLA